MPQPPNPDDYDPDIEPLVQGLREMGYEELADEIENGEFPVVNKHLKAEDRKPFAGAQQVVEGFTILEPNKPEPKTDWPAVANTVREGEFYVCFEEPDEPLVWAAITNEGMLKKARDRSIEWNRKNCIEKHPGLGCDFYLFVRQARNPTSY